MRPLLLILGYLIADSALADPCVNHTVLDQPWRSTDCKRTQCTRQWKWKCDDDLDYGWYRFKSSGGWKIPETDVPDHRCSTKAPSWLNGAHPTVGQGEVTRTVYFHWKGNPCYWSGEIKVKNCTSYFVYELKPTNCSNQLYTAYCTDADSALTDPCVSHTVLDQPWRSTDCREKQCTRQWKCDRNLTNGWYRFKSSGGWKIPETVVPEYRCSTKASGWLNGSHPAVGQGVVTRTVCFHWPGNPCNRTREIKIKNCTSYFVYELKPTGWRKAYCTDADSALTDPCVNHTVLDQPWRSTNCSGTQCTRQRKCDWNLTYGWYRFKSSGGWKIPETDVPEYHCSTKASGWLNGSHPAMGQGEVTRTVCFHWAGNPCKKTREIKIKNCSSYFVYELKPTPWCKAYCTDADSALTDPCVNHTVLDQPWRSTDCSETQCTSQWKCDRNLTYRWYRFKSSGGWKIPETFVPEYQCSTKAPGWLKGSHPTMDQGEVTRTVCFHWEANPCNRTREIQIKNCTSYFVYELKPTNCSNQVYTAYCTDPNTSTTHEPEEQSTQESFDHSSIIPAGSVASDPEKSTTQEPEEKSTQESADLSSTIPVGAATSDPDTSPTQGPQEQSTQESVDHSSTIPAGSATSGPGKRTSPGSKGESTSGAECKPSKAGHLRPGVLQLTDEECEKVSAEVQVMYVGKNKLDAPEKKKTYLHQVQDMLKDHLPCKKLPLKFKDVKTTKPRKKKRK